MMSNPERPCERSLLTSIHFPVDRGLSSAKFLQFGLSSHLNSFKLTMASISSDTEMSFDSEDSEINCIAGYEIFR